MDLVDIASRTKQIADIGKSIIDKQRDINVSDVWHMWDLLATHYDLIEIHHVMTNFIKDNDFKIVSHKTINYLQKGSGMLEKKMLEYSIPLPGRPRQESNTTVNLEVVTDKYIFVRILNGIGSMLPVLTSAFLNGATPTAIKIFKELIHDNINIYDNLSVYGKAKGYLEQLPTYNPWT